MLRGGEGDDSLFGFSANDAAFGGAGDDSLDGRDGGDTLVGGAGDDAISGGASVDFLTGSAGDDTMNGGAGADRFVFLRGHGNDLIEDFQNGTDKLDLKFFDLSAATLKADYAKASGGGVLIDLRDLGGGTIQVNGLTYAQLDAADLIL